MVQRTFALLSVQYYIVHVHAHVHAHRTLLFIIIKLFNLIKNKESRSSLEITEAVKYKSYKIVAFNTKAKNRNQRMKVKFLIRLRFSK